MNATDTQALLGAAGPGELIEALDQTWHVSPATQNVQAAYAAWLKLQARKELIETREDLGEDVYREEMSALKARIDAGEYNWGGPVWQASIRREAGFLHLFWLLLQRKHPLMTPAEAVKVYFAAPELCAAAANAALEAGDPKRFAPAPKKATGANDEAAASASSKSTPSSSTKDGPSTESPTLTTAS